MNIKNLLYILPLLIFSCTEDVVEGEGSIDLGINFNTSSAVIFHYQNAQNSLFLETEFYNTFPSETIDNNFTPTKNNGTKVLTLNIQHPQTIDLSYGNFTTTFFLVPNDTLEIYIDLDTTQNITKSIKYAGEYASINDYYKDKELYLNKTTYELNYAKAMAFNFAKTISEYTIRIDSLTQKELDYINNYEDITVLPKWFIDYEITSLKNRAAENKISIVWYREYMNGIKDSIPENYYSDIEHSIISSPNSILSYSYFHYLRSQIQLKAKQSHDSLNPRTTKESHEFFINESLHNLPKITSDIFLTISLDMLINFGGLNDTIYSLYHNAITNNKFKAYLEDRKKNAEVLKPGENAPPFMLPNIDGKNLN